MKKLWPYIAAFFAGVSVMAIAALKWFAGDDVKVIIRKIKNKNISGTSDIDIPITVDKTEKRLKSRKERKLDRLHKRADKLNIN